MAVSRDDPYPAYAFLVEIDGLARAGFSQVSGLDQEIEVISYREGADPLTPRLLPGVIRPVNATFRRGVTGDLGLQQWFDAVRTGQTGAIRRNVLVHLLSESREAVLSWRLVGAFPSKLEGPALDAGSSAVAIETLVLVCGSLSVE